MIDWLQKELTGAIGSTYFFYVLAFQVGATWIAQHSDLQRKSGQRRATVGMMLSGLALILILLTVLADGWWIAVEVAILAWILGGFIAGLFR